MFSLIKIVQSLAPTVLLISMFANLPFFHLHASEFNLNNEALELGTDTRPQDVIHWTALQSNSYPDGYVEVSVKLNTSHNFSIYKKNLEFIGNGDYFFYSVKAPKTSKIIDPISQEEVEVFSSGEFKIYFSGVDEFKGSTFPFSIKYVGCTKILCLFPFVETFEVSIYPSPLSSREGLVKQDESEPRLGEQTNNTEPIENPKSYSSMNEIETSFVNKMNARTSSFWLMLVFAVLGGLLTNLTPCVYPMIPITIRLLKGQSEKPIVASIFYGSGIILTYTSLGLLAAAGGAMFGNIMASQSINIFFSIFMAYMAITMLGFGNLSFLQNIGTKLDSKHNSIANAFILGTGAGLVASPCTGPILAALLAYASTQDSLYQSALLMFTYSFGFALPYIFLGSFASNLYKIKAPAIVQNLSKILFAGIIFALSLYYLKIPAYSLVKQMNTYWQYIGTTFLAISSISMFYFIKNTQTNFQKEAALAPALFIGISLFSWVQWASKKSLPEDINITWLSHEQEALSLAASTDRPILIDMWAEWCSACKKMDATTFSDRAFLKKLAKHKWILLKLDLTQSTDETDKIEKKYNLLGLPTLVLIPPPSLNLNQTVLNGYISTETLEKHIEQFSRD